MENNTPSKDESRSDSCASPCSDFLELPPGTKLQAGDQVRWGGAWRNVCQDFKKLEEWNVIPWPTVTKGIRYRRPNEKGQP